MRKEIDDLFIKEMGFALVVEELIAAKKPVIGHNMIYDVIYLYNQFVDDLPETYPEFSQKWYSLFPLVYDNKVLSSAAEYFGRTDLGKVYDKCLNDERIKGSGMRIAFDVQKGFTRYEGSEQLSHYHEAAYDAYMTGFSFANILKFKEFDKGKPQKGPGNAGQNASGSKPTPVAKEEGKTEEPGSAKIRYEHLFASKYLNKVMLSPYTMEFYNLNPTKQAEDDVGEKDYSKILWVQMDESIEETADRLSHRLAEFGDFNIFKDSQSSFFMEFYFLEPDTVPSQTVDELISIILRPQNA